LAFLLCFSACEVTARAGRRRLDTVGERFIWRTLTDIEWYEAFGLRKQAAVLQQLYRRFELGETQDARFNRFPAHIPAMLDAVLEMLR